MSPDPPNQGHAKLSLPCLHQPPLPAHYPLSPKLPLTRQQKGKEHREKGKEGKESITVEGGGGKRGWGRRKRQTVANAQEKKERKTNVHHCTCNGTLPACLLCGRGRGEESLLPLLRPFLLSVCTRCQKMKPAGSRDASMDGYWFLQKGKGMEVCVGVKIKRAYGVRREMRRKENQITRQKA